MPDTVVEMIPDSEPTIRMEDFVEFLINNMSEAEQNEAIKIIVESVNKTRLEQLKYHTNAHDRLDAANAQLEDILKANC